MKRTAKTTAAVAICLLLAAAVPAFAQQGAVNLTLKEAIRIVFERNLDLKVELYNPAMAEADIRRSLGIYDPLAFLGASYNRSNATNTLTFSPQEIDEAFVNAGISQLLPTGTLVEVTADSGRIDNSARFYTNAVNLAVSQPLWRNSGREVTELEINVSRLGKEESLERFRTRLSDTVAQLRNDYFGLYNLREVLAVRKSSLALANTILEETKGRVRAGVLPAMEILNAEFVASTREKEVIDAERAVRDQMDVLRVTLQLDPGVEIVLADGPYRESYPVSPDAALALALQNRPELAAQRSAIRITDLQQRVARNQTLPDLLLTANLGAGGDDRRFMRGLEKTASAEDPSWGVGLQISYPLGNRAAENSYIRSRLAMEQAQTQLQNLEAGISRDVKAAARLVESSYKQIEVTSRGRAYAEERLRAFEKRHAVGLATTKDVFDVEEDLVTAKGAQIQALVDYNNAITRLWRATGEILEREGIRVSERQADPLYEKLK